RARRRQGPLRGRRGRAGCRGRRRGGARGFRTCAAAQIRDRASRACDGRGGGRGVRPVLRRAPRTGREGPSRPVAPLGTSRRRNETRATACSPVYGERTFTALVLNVIRAIGTSWGWNTVTDTGDGRFRRARK